MNERTAPDGRRVVVKVGSKSLVGDGSGPRFEALAKQIAALRAERRAVLVVSSGAIALGRSALGFDKRPTEIAQLQACAAVGQSRLMRAWEEAFAPYGVPVAQLLLTHADLADRERYLNARAALDALWELGAVPVINENDTVAVEEIKFGDNDQLAAMVATLAGADLLVLLSDVEGLLDREGKRVPLVSDVSEALALVGASSSDLGTGGMASKLEAARRAAKRGVPVVIADARDGRALERVVSGEDVGTLIAPLGAKLASRKHWIAFTLRPRGTLLLDEGAAKAIRSGGRSLLPAGVIGVRGDFSPGDAVTLCDAAGAEIARGLARYGTRDVAKLAGANTRDIASILGFHGGDEIVHRDDLVVL
ncbi:glutamate 5-kinase [Sandaracinus amylolyticus]|uniref:Glutamate 5-kinase n=1 Tax=Sandaracinus amylolyticus TaxID=927083 RepID=A0A0F6SFE2_9BACT|nr:glutamate 5-kinase [Sandaracinus amylolyticus]AKF06789.1 Glutamate 5-kinase [Sandaracinus amylolyticus]